MVSKCIEWNIPIWIVSIDLRKAFDRVEHSKLFDALARLNVDDNYIYLLKLLYENQEEIVGNMIRFPIRRGVRQGDVLSPVLFNAALEAALRDWKATCA